MHINCNAVSVNYENRFVNFCGMKSTPRGCLKPAYLVSLPGYHIIILAKCFWKVTPMKTGLKETYIC